MTRLPQFPPSITIEVPSYFCDMEIIEIAIDEAFKAVSFPCFKLEPICVASHDYGVTMISYDVIKLNIDVNKLIYGRYK